MTPELIERVALAIAHVKTWDGDLLWHHHTAAELNTAARAAIAVIVEECAKVAGKATPRAHTYASENADIYRAYDKGAADAIKAIRALAKEAE